MSPVSPFFCLYQHLVRFQNKIIRNISFVWSFWKPMRPCVRLLSYCVFPVSLRCGLAKRTVGSTGVQPTSPPVNVSTQFPPQHAFLWLSFTHSLVASSSCALQGTARQSCLTVAPHGLTGRCTLTRGVERTAASCRRTSPWYPTHTV